jgi:transcription antitermination factor NusG
MELWYALRVRSNFEKVVQSALRNHGLDEFLPLYETVSRWSDRTKRVDWPLFPGYVFGRFDAANRLPVLMMPGVVRILGSSAGPIPVDHEELQAVRRSIESGLPLMPWPYLAVGDRVVVEDGALAGLEGVLVRLKNRLRIVVSVNLLQRSVAAEINRSRVRPVTPLAARAPQCRNHKATAAQPANSLNPR